MSVYTPQILRLALETAQWPRIDRAQAGSTRRAPVCGSKIILDLNLEQDRISAIGMDVRACALGQAASTLFARAALGKSLAEMSSAHDAFAAWLTNQTDAAPDWPEITLLEAVRALPARHGAVLLPFDAAVDALTSVTCAHE